MPAVVGLVGGHLRPLIQRQISCQSCLKVVGNEGSEATRPSQPVRRRKGPLKRSRRLGSRAPGTVKKGQLTASTPAIDSPRGRHNNDRSQIETLDEMEVSGPPKEVTSRHFIPVSIPRSDDGRVFQLPYHTNLSDEEKMPNDPEDMCVLPKPIYVVSDCTGESAANTVRAALGQFENCFKTSCPANLLIFRFLSSPKKAYEIVNQAAQDDALVVFTLVEHELVTAMISACRLSEVKYVDLWSNLMDLMEEHLETVRSGVPLGRGSRSELSSDYFKMIEAVEFTRKMDDGAHPEKWMEADLLLLGVSRSGKTPLCIYLGQRGYKVANLPLVEGLPLPKQLYDIDQTKIFGLIIKSGALMDIRQSRMGNMGVHTSTSNYADLKGINSELGYAQNLYKENPEWPVLDVTHCGIEETAARILKILSDRMGDVHPMWASPGEE